MEPRPTTGGANPVEGEPMRSLVSTLLVLATLAAAASAVASVRDVVVRYLERDGYDTLQAGDGESARALIASHRPDLVVLDVMLPGTDGLTLCRWIRSSSDLPVIMLTARGEAADRVVGLELGADDYLTKPFPPRALAIRV